MNIRRSLKTKLEQIPAVAQYCVTEVNGAPQSNVFWLRDPSGDRNPCIVFEVIGGDAGESDACEQNGPFTADVAIRVFAQDPEAAISVSEAMLAALRGVSWALEGVSVQYCSVSEVMADEYFGEPELQLYMTGIVVRIVYA